MKQPLNPGPMLQGSWGFTEGPPAKTDSFSKEITKFMEADINKLFCKTMHDFVAEHIDEIWRDLSALSRPKDYYNTKTNLLKQVKKSCDEAVYVLSEMPQYLSDQFVMHHDNEDEIEIYRIFKIINNQPYNRYFTTHVINGEYSIEEMEPVQRITYEFKPKTTSNENKLIGNHNFSFRNP